MECPECHANTYAFINQELAERVSGSPDDLWAQAPQYIREYACSSCGYTYREEPGSLLSNTQPGANRAVRVDPFKLEVLRQQAGEKQNLLLGLVAGVAAAVIGAILWAVITVFTNHQIGWMAIGVGLLVGLAVHQFGRGIDPIYGILGAVLAFLGCLVGNLLAVAILASQEGTVSLVEALLVFLIAPETVIEVLQITFQPIDFLFYGLAIYEGYRFSFGKTVQAQEAS